MITYKKGFTLLELLVVIALIGIFAAIVLAFVSSARGGASDSKIKSQMNSMKNQAELYIGTGSSSNPPGTTCAAALITSNDLFNPISNGLGNLLAGLPAGSICNSQSGLPSTGATWVVAAPLSAGIWCVDSTGAARSKNTSGNAYTIAYSVSTPVPPIYAAIINPNINCQ